MIDANKLINQAQSLGARVWVDGRSLEVDLPSDFPEDVLQRLKDHKVSIMAALSQEIVDPESWPPADVRELLYHWDRLDRPEIPLAPGVGISNLETWLWSRRPEVDLLEQVTVVRRYLWESLPANEVSSTDPVLEDWRRTMIPSCRRQLEEAIRTGNREEASQARWMLRDVLEDPEYREGPHDQRR